MIKLLIIGADLQAAEAVCLSIGMRWPDANVWVRTTAAEGLELAEQTSPDVVLLYSGLPDMDLAEAIRGLRRTSNVLLLVLGHQGSETEIVTALQFGADYYVKLPCGMTELMARISCLLRRAGTAVRQEEGKLLPSSSMVLNPATCEVVMGDRRVMLTSTEFRLLNRLLRNSSTAAFHENRENKTMGEPEDSSGALEKYAQFIAEINNLTIQASTELWQDIEQPHHSEPQ